ncbi:MAG: hypothetical protein OEZ43_15315 [Gammaproteobacteria bacterium]|nr:hypothetical protein [Gammaproteobacteria bacterium]
MTVLTKKLAVASAFLCALTTQVQAAEPSHLEHPHSAGTIMFEYKYMRMAMDGLRSGTKEVTTAEGLAQGYDMVPTSMTMDMHMIMPMYNFTPALSAMLMLNFLDNNMAMINATGGEHPMQSTGLGDTHLSLSYKFLDNMLAFSVDLSLPTGSTSEMMTMDHGTGPMPMSAPYAMQLGSGTYDVTPSIYYLGAYYDLRYGAMASYTYRVGDNDEGYSLADKADAMIWVRKPVSGVSLDAEVKLMSWGGIDGRHSGIYSSMETTPALKTANYGGTAVEMTVGAAIPVGPTTIGFDVGLPVYQNLRGLQMERTFNMSASLSAMF